MSQIMQTYELSFAQQFKTSSVVLASQLVHDYLQLHRYRQKFKKTLNVLDSAHFQNKLSQPPEYVLGLSEWSNATLTTSNCLGMLRMENYLKCLRFGKHHR